LTGFDFSITFYSLLFSSYIVPFCCWKWITTASANELPKIRWKWYCY